jgi:hypothetical protein
MMREQAEMIEKRGSPSRTDRYIARIQTHLPGLKNDAARRDFISDDDKWEERYARFIETEGESHRRGDGPGQPTAFDFVETLAALGATQSRCTERRPEVGYIRPQQA